MVKSILNKGVKPFTLYFDTYTTGFQEHINLSLLSPIDEKQLKRQRLHFNIHDLRTGYFDQFKKIIEHNASLRLDFGWSFESATHLNEVIDTCINDVVPKYNVNVGRMVSDLRCSWLGFEPHNMYDKEVYKEFTPLELVIYNNEIIDFQIEIAKTISSHPTYIQHAFLKDDWFRFETFKVARKDRELLEEKYHYHMKAIRQILGPIALPRDILEKDIGMHFLYHPDLFFELLEFSILKGDVYE